MPATSDLAVVSVYFNPCGYRSTVANFLQFYEAIRRQTSSFFAVELAFGDGPFYLPELEGVSRARTKDVLWQKDRLLNHLIRQLPQSYRKVAWVDADVLFENEQWCDQASGLLDRFSVVQPFQTAIWLDRSGQEIRRAPSAADAAQRDPSLLRQPSTCHPGFAWAARRDLLERHGLYDRCIAGGNDSIFTWGMFGMIWGGLMSCYPSRLQQDIEGWAKGVFAEVRGGVGCVEGTVKHLWHGNHLHRQYLSRNQILVEEGYDPQHDIRVDASGAWSWATEKPRLHEGIRAFFFSRREDGNAQAPSSCSTRSATDSTERPGS